MHKSQLLAASKIPFIRQLYFAINYILEAFIGCILSAVSQRSPFASKIIIIVYKLYLAVLFLAAAIIRFNLLYAVSGAIKILRDKTRYAMRKMIQHLYTPHIYSQTQCFCVRITMMAFAVRIRGKMSGGANFVFIPCNPNYNT